MRHALVPALLWAAPLAAQTSPPPVAAPVPELPGAGRPVAIEAHRARRAKLMDRVGNGVIVIPAAGERDLEASVLQDNDFRQDDYFFYLTGIESPNAWLLLVASTEGEDRVTLYLPRRNAGRERWTGKKLGPGDDAVRLIGIDDVRALVRDSLDRAVERATSQNPGPLYTIIYRGSRSNEPIQRWIEVGWNPDNIVPLIDSLRVVKDAAELAALRRAITITTEAHKAAMQTLQPGMFEYQLEATIEYTFRNLGADRVGFPSIVGSGPNSTTLHYDVNRRQMQEGELVVVDIGAEYGQYTADVTRTLPVDGEFTERQKAIYNLVLGTQQAAIEAVKPGVTIRDLRRVARQHMRDHSGELCGGSDCTRYFIHGLSHWIGMRVHDVGDYSMPLEPGMVLTIEPGIYIPEENLGVRIEDDILVTEGGHEVLSAAAPRTTDDIESLMRLGNRQKAGGSYR